MVSVGCESQVSATLVSEPAEMGFEQGALGYTVSSAPNSAYACHGQLSLPNVQRDPSQHALHSD